MIESHAPSALRRWLLGCGCVVALLALAQLANLDPAVRLLGMQSLRSIATANDVPIAMRLLGDTEPRVVVASAQVLRQATGLDFGIRSAQAMPQFTGIGTNPPPAPDLQAISQGVQRWRDWWNNHQAEYPTSPLTSPLTSPQRNPVAFFGTPDFSLEDSRGKPVHLFDYRGKVVMLVFWSLDTAANLDVLALKALQPRNPDRLAILGICIPEVPSCADEHEQGPEQAHHHESSTPAMDAGQMRAMIERFRLVWRRQ